MRLRVVHGKRGKNTVVEVGLGKGRPAADGGQLRDVGDLPGGGVLAQMGNSCGTCSLSAVMRHFGVNRKPGEIDREIRNANIYTAPDLVARYARRNGFAAVIRNSGSIDEVKGFTGRGIPVLLLVISRPGTRVRPPVLHYVTAISFREVAGGSRVGIYNPWGLREEVTADELSEIWDDIRIGPFSCWRSAFIPVAPAGTDLGCNRRPGTRGPDLLSVAAADAVNGAFHVLRDSRVTEGIVELARAPLEAAAGLLFFVLERLSGRPGGPSS